MCVCFRRNSNESSNFDLACGLAAARVMDLHLVVIWARWRSWVFGTTTHFAFTPSVTHQGEERPTDACLPSKLAPAPFLLMRNIETRQDVSSLCHLAFLDVLKIRNLLILLGQVCHSPGSPLLLALPLNCIFTWLLTKENLNVFKLCAWSIVQYLLHQWRKNCESH